MASTTGFSEEKVNAMMGNFNSDSTNVMEVLTTEFNKVIDAMAKNWGTQDGVTWVGQTFIPSLKKTGQSVADTIVEIGKVLRVTAQQQAADTKNSVSIVSEKKATLGELSNNMQPKLDNGFVGVYDDLISKVSKAHDNLVSNVDKAIDRLQKHAVSSSGDAFKESGKAGKVKEQIDSYIEKIQAEIDKAFVTLNQSIDENTKNADKYAHDIQQAGLRSGGSN